MKKQLILTWIILSSGITFLSAQEKIKVHQHNQIVYELWVSELENVCFQNETSFFNRVDGNRQEILLSMIDSITFLTESPVIEGNKVYILYNENQISIINPLVDQGVQVVADQGDVIVTSTSGIPNIEYAVSGTTGNGSLTISSYQPVVLTLDNIHITGNANSAVNITSNITTRINMADNTENDLSDGSANTKNAVLTSKGNLVFEGQGNLNIKAHAKHALASDKSIIVESGNISVTEAVSDGFHSEGFVMNGGALTLSAGGDGIDAGTGTVEINAGTIRINSLTADVKGIKCDETLTIDGGNISMNLAGAQSKGLSSKKEIVINGGSISIIASGAAVLTALTTGYDPSYCTAIKCDGNITVNNGDITIESKNTSDGGKGFSADGNIIVNNGKIHISTAGNGATYTNESNTTDSYTACCIKSNGNISLTGGTITCSSSGTGGKGISADGTLSIGNQGADDEQLILDVTTSGERFLVSGGTSGGGRPGGNTTGNSSDYANPKAIKSEGNLIIYSGTITVNCTQTDEGGEGIESKATLTIQGGNLTVRTNDDAINAASNITIAGGTIYCSSIGNDAIDSNGTLTVTGGFTIANGTRSPEEGFDCDNNTFSVKGGVILGTGGATSSPTTNSCTQRSIVYTGTQGSAICLKNSAGEIILLYQMPSFSGSGQGGGQSGGNSMVVLFSDPCLIDGSYTLQYGGSISGGTTVNGYNTGGSYTGGSQKNVTITSMLTTVNNR
jgi:hypothetical protein